MSTILFQKQLFEAVQGKFSRKQDMILFLSDLLSVSNDGVYRRLRGDTILTPDEIAILATKFRISLDKILYGQSDSQLFSYNLLSSPIKSFRNYIEQVYKNLLNVIKIEDIQVYYASQEIPIFQYFPFPGLLSFKLYVYGITSWGFDFLKGKKYHQRLIDPEVLTLSAECVRLYEHIPSKDIWSLNIVDNTLNQIEYMATVELFENPNDAFLICDEIIELIDKAKEMALNGKKSLKSEEQQGRGDFDLYYNEMISTNNTIFMRSPVGKLVFTTINNPNFIISSDPPFCELIEKWFEMIISLSTSISVHSEKSRDWYFNRLKKKVQAIRDKIGYL
jgi:hypothetical protein